LDNGASVSLFANGKLLSNVRIAEKPIIITGVAKEKKIVATKVGSYMGIDNVYICPEAAANLLSFSATAATCNNLYDRASDSFTSTPEAGNTLVFSRNSRGLYAYRHRSGMLEDNGFAREVMALTVEEIKKSYTKDQVERATEVRALTMKLAYPSDEALLSLLKNSIRDKGSAALNRSDVQNALDIYGKSLGCLRGKSTRRQIALPGVTIGGPLLPEHLRVVSLHVDLFFLLGSVFLLSVSEPIGLRMASFLGLIGEGARGTKNVKEAVIKQNNVYKSRGFTVSSVISDGEGAVKAIKNDLEAAGIVVNIVGAGAHVPKAERNVRLVKERVRAIIQVLPFNLPGSWVKFLVRFAINRINMFTTKGGLVSISPFEVFNGRPVNLRNDVKVSFGEYAEVLVPETDNSMAQRTRAAIALGQSDNTSGSGIFFNLETKSTFLSDLWTSRPMPMTVVNEINALARRESRKHYSSQDLNDFLNEEDIEEAEAIEEEVISSMGESGVMEDSATEQRARNIPQDPDQSSGLPNIQVSPDVSDPMEEVPLLIPTNPTDTSDDDLESNMASMSLPTTVQLPHRDNQEDATQQAFRPTRQGLTSTRVTRSLSSILRQPTTPTPSEVLLGVLSEPSGRLAVTGSGRCTVVPWSRTRTVKDTPCSIISYDYDSPRPDFIAREANTLTEEPIETHEIYHMSVREAKIKDAKATDDSIKLELQQMLDKNVFLPISTSTPIGPDAIESFIFMKEKYDSEGNFVKLKARLVANGSQQNHLDEEYSPTVRSVNLLVLIMIAAREERHVRTEDVPGAYLLASLERENVTMVLRKDITRLLVELDPSYQQYVRRNGSILVQVMKALYGLIQSAKLWYQLVKHALISEGFVMNLHDPCIFNKWLDDIQCTIAIYVDDLFISCKDVLILDKVEMLLKKHFNDITVASGPVQSYVGMTLDYSMPGQVSISMSHYVKEILKSFEEIKMTSSPAEDSLFEIDVESPPLIETDRVAFHSTVAKILYLAKRTRPDLLLATSFLATRVTKATIEDQQKLERLGAYLKKTKDLSLLLLCPNTSPINVLTYVDASYGVHPDGKSHSGAVISVGGGCILAKSVKQKIVTKSSTEAELVALSDHAGAGIELGKLIHNQLHGGTNPDATVPVTLLQDNMSTIAMIRNGRPNHDSTRHISIRNFWMTERVNNGEIELAHCPTELMIADLLTKPLQGRPLLKLRNSILKGSTNEKDDKDL
jgi:hypothetical protein